MQCKKCGTEIPEGKPFCLNCGEGVPYCYHCHSIVTTPNGKFCQECGSEEIEEYCPEAISDSPDSFYSCRKSVVSASIVNPFPFFCVGLNVLLILFGIGLAALYIPGIIEDSSLRSLCGFGTTILGIVIFVLALIAAIVGVNKLCSSGNK